VTVAGVATLFVCCTITATVALGVFCRKRNIVFPLESKSDADDDDDDECSGDMVESTSKNDHHQDHHHHHLDYQRHHLHQHHRHHQRRFHSSECIHTLTGDQPGALQLSPDIVTQSSDQNDAHFRFTSDDVDDNPFPVASAHEHSDVSCCSEAGEAKSRDVDEHEYSVQITNITDDCSMTQTYCTTAHDTTTTTTTTVTSSSSLSFLSLLAKLYRPQVMRSLSHALADVINWRVIRPQRVPAVTGDQSAAGDVARDDVDLTSLLPTL